MSLKKALMFDAYHNKIRHTYVNTDDPKGINWVLSTEKYSILLNLLINGSIYLVVGDKKSNSEKGIMVKYEDQIYILKGNILFLCVSDDRMSVKESEISEKELSNFCKIMGNND